MTDEIIEMKEGRANETKAKSSETETQKENFSYTKLTLSAEDKKEIAKTLMTRFEELNTDRQGIKFDEECEVCDRQYDGQVKDKGYGIFNLHIHETKKKVRSMARRIKRAFFESDPKFHVSVRPEDSDVPGIEEIAQAQEENLDYEFDINIPFEEPCEKAIFDAVLKGVGIIKIPWEYRCEYVKDEEIYYGKKDLDNFNDKYPKDGEYDKDRTSMLNSFRNRIENDETVYLSVEEKRVAYNNPKPKHVNPLNFWVDIKCEGFEGLKTTAYTFEKEDYTWQRMKELEAEGKFFDVDDVIQKEDKEKKEVLIDSDYQTKAHEVLECVCYLPKGKNNSLIKSVVYLHKDSGKIIGAIGFPYWHNRPYYIPFYSSCKESGFYKSGMGKELRDINLAINATVNFTLDGAFIENTQTPLCKKNSPVAKQLQENSWWHNRPLYYQDRIDEIGLMPKSPINHAALMNFIYYLKKEGDDVSTIQSYMMGKESDLDPTAPAAKTAMLLQEGSVEIKDVIKTMLPTFNEIAYQILELFYQFNREGRKYRRKAKDERIGVISLEKDRDDKKSNARTGFLTRKMMRTRTYIQANAYSFSLDKINEKKEDLAFYQIFRQELIGNPKGLWTVLYNMGKNWSPKWKDLIDQILPTPEQLDQQIAMVALQAVANYAQMAQEQAQVTGQDPAFNIEEVVAQVKQAIMVMTNPQAQTESKGGK